MILFLSFKFYFFLPTFFSPTFFFLLFTSFMIYFLLMIFLSPNTQFYPLLFCHKMKKIKNLPLHPFFQKRLSCFKQDNCLYIHKCLYKQLSLSEKALGAFPFFAPGRTNTCDVFALRTAKTKKESANSLIFIIFHIIPTAHMINKPLKILFHCKNLSFCKIDIPFF